MKTMKKRLLALSGLMAGAALFNQQAVAELSTPPASPAELEAAYTASIESRTEDILKPLALTDAAKSNAVHDLIISQYRVMRARDALIDAKLAAQGKEINYANRASQLEEESQILHDYFLARLAKLLTPEAIEKVKDKMTYNKVKITYDAYVSIVPGLTDADKARMMELLKAAREKAMDGGSAVEKSAIFQVYKDQINDYLNAHGHDVAKAYREWEARQATAKVSSGTSNAVTNAVQ
jgi:hypothetical protein